MEHSKIEVSDTLVLFADLQAGIADLPLTVPYTRLQKGVLALSRLAHLLGMPAIVSAIQGQVTIALPPTRSRIKLSNRRLRPLAGRQF